MQSSQGDVKIFKNPPIEDGSTRGWEEADEEGERAGGQDACMYTIADIRATCVSNAH